MAQTDWGLIKIQYEMFGEDLDVLAEEYGVRPRALRYAADEGGWKRLPVGKVVRDWTEIESMEDISDEIIDSVKKRQDILYTLKQSALLPRYILLEAALLGKATEVVHGVSPEHPTAAAQLKMAADILTSLREK